MERFSATFNLSTMPTHALKSLYCLLFNKLASPCLAAPQKRQLRAAISEVAAELQARRVL